MRLRNELSDGMRMMNWKRVIVDIDDGQIFRWLELIFHSTIYTMRGFLNLILVVVLVDRVLRSFFAIMLISVYCSPTIWYRVQNWSKDEILAHYPLFLVDSTLTNISLHWQYEKNSRKVLSQPRCDWLSIFFCNVHLLCPIRFQTAFRWSMFVNRP